MFNLKVLHYISDFSGCYFFRVKVPFDSLKAYGVYNSNYCFIPSDPYTSQDYLLHDMIKEFDVVIIQRCYLLPFVEKVARICEFLGKPIIFETDDDYFNLIPSNPAYWAIVSDQELFRKFNDQRIESAKLKYQGLDSTESDKKAEEYLPALIESRNKGIEEYKEILKMVDFVTVSTEELARTIRPYNKNVQVFQNNVDRIFPWKDSLPLQHFLTTDDEGRQAVKIDDTLGIYRIPNYHVMDDKVYHLPRIGYSGTESHRGEDWETIRNPLDEFCARNPKGYFFSFIGDPWFFEQMKDKSSAFCVEGSDYDKYIVNLKNIDIMLCPLSPTIFNMSKSDIKLVEAASWGTPGLAPRYITYSRNFVDEETCLMYGNGDEFVYQLERLVKDHKLRNTLGKNALHYVANSRLEIMHSAKRFEFLKSAVAFKKQLEIFTPNLKEEVTC